MKTARSHISRNAIGALFLLFVSTSGAGSGSAMIRLQKHVPTKAIARSQHLQRMQKDAPIQLAISLKLKNEAALAEQIRRIHDPSDPLYGHYLTPEQFTQTYAPSQQELNEVTQYLIGRGLKVSKTHANRLVVNVEGPAADIENAFQLELHQYKTPEGRVAYGPNAEPLVSATIAPRLTGVAGLDSFSNIHNHFRRPQMGPHATFTAATAGLGPADIKKAYQLTSVSQTGAGQIIALQEFDGYLVSDITAYAKQYGITNPPVLQNILVDGYSGAAGSGSDEVTLDIQLAMALAPGASKILVYEGPLTDAGTLDTLSKIATDNLAKQVSMSWGQPEIGATPSVITSQNTILMQMAAQGQTYFVASGDNGAYDNGDTTLEVDDPGSQPYAVDVGGTTLKVDASKNYLSETTWTDLTSNPKGGSGGGISSTWPLPSWQTGLGTTANLGSTTKRMVPDVSLGADPSSNGAYALLIAGVWQPGGGTSCAAPLWAAFTALVNQQRAANNLAPLGFANPMFYQLAATSQYNAIFHDIADKSTNLYYPATTGYDLATGLGSFNGAGLFQALTTTPSKHAAPKAPVLTVL